MSSKHFSWLLAATILAAIVIFLIPGKTGTQSEFESSRLLPDLAARVNDIEQVQVVGSGGATVVTLQRQDGLWLATESGAYPADWPKLRKLLEALAKAEVTEPKTSNPQYFSRLGVENVEAADSRSTLLRVGPENDGWAVIVGNSAEGREGQYVRLAGTDQALLINQQLEVSQEVRDWLNREIINISDSELVEFSVTQADGEKFTAKKASADDDDFTLQAIPQDREVLSAWTVNSIAGALSDLQLDAVQDADSIDFSAAIAFRALTADGLELLADLVTLGDQDWIRLQAREFKVESPNPEEPLVIATESDDVAKTASEEPNPAETEEIDTAVRAAEINQRVSAWAYAIPSYKAEVMKKRIEDLLKSPAEAE